MTSSASGSGNPQISLKGQYIKDLSFENPHAPGSLLALQERPQIDVNVNLRAGRVQEHLYELNFLITAKATAEDNTVFLVELTYGGLFALNNVPEERVEQVLLIDCPFILFPFARRVISDITRDGGFPPLLLDPIDFHALYLQNREHIKRAGGAEKAAAGA